MITYKIGNPSNKNNKAFPVDRKGFMHTATSLICLFLQVVNNTLHV